MGIFVLCVKIFCARIIDVSMGTFRTMLVVKGKTIYAALTAFFEVFIWFVIAREALNTEITSLFVPISYAAGYATGTLLGSYLSQKYIEGIIGVQIIVNKTNKDLINTLRDNGYAVSVIPLEDSFEQEEKHMLFIQINKNKLKGLTKLVKSLDSKAFIVVNDTKYTYNGFIK